jgi:hypothetical protein
MSVVECSVLGRRASRKPSRSFAGRGFIYKHCSKATGLEAGPGSKLPTAATSSA